MILRTLGKVAPPSAQWEHIRRQRRRVEVSEAFARKRCYLTARDGGSGLSRNDMVTAEASVQLLTDMTANGSRALASFAIAGIDGTLRNRMRGTVAENNVRAKTGSLSSAATLSGYVTTAAGENLAFSIMVNNYPEDTEVRTLCIDPIAVLLASFAGKS